MAYSEDIEEIFSHVNKIKAKFEKMDPLKSATINTNQESEDSEQPEQDSVMFVDEQSLLEKIENYENKILKYDLKLEEKDLLIQKLNKDIELKNSLIEQHTFENERLKYDLSNKEEECVASFEKLRHSKNKLKEKDSEVSLLKNKLKEKERALNMLNQKIVSLNDESLKKEKRLEENHLIIQKLNKDITEKNSLIEQHTNEIEKLKSQLINKMEKYVSSVKKMKEYKNKFQEKEKRLEENHLIIQKLNKDITEKNSLIEQHTNEIEKLKHLKNELQEKEKNLESLNQKVSLLTDEAFKKDRKIEILNKRNERDKKRISTKTEKIIKLNKELEKSNGSSDIYQQKKLRNNDSEDLVMKNSLEDSMYEPNSNPQIQDTQIMDRLEINDTDFEDNLAKETDVSLKEKSIESINEHSTDRESTSKMIQKHDSMTISERMKIFQEQINSLNFPDLTNGACDICGENIELEKNLSGLVVAGNFFACENCCKNISKKELSDWTKSKMDKPNDVRSIGLWLTQNKNKQNDIRGNIKF